MEVIVTKHAEKRIRQRLGLPKSSVQKIAQEAMDNGIKRREIKGTLGKYLTAVKFRGKSKGPFIFYKDKVFIFSGHILVTVLPVTGSWILKLRRLAESD